MKYKITFLALLAAIPSVVWAGVSFLSTDPVYIISETEREDTPATVIQSYRLEWNQAVGKFDLLPGRERRPITIEESMQPSPIDPPSSSEPIYYDYLV